MSNFSSVFSPGETKSNPGKKKRKRKKKKKSDPDSYGTKNNNNDSQRVKSFISLGFTRDEVHKCFDKMFAAGEDMNDDEKVKEFLNRSKNASSTTISTPSSKSSTTVSSTTTTKSTPPSSPKRESSTSSAADATIEAAVTANETKKGESQPLDERLEEATLMPAKIVMPVLIKWCRNYPNDRPTLFQSKALQQLFSNYLKDLLTNSNTLDPSERQLYEAPMNELLHLAIGNNELADVISTQLSHFIHAASSMQMQSDELNNVSDSLSTTLVNKIRTFHRSTTYDENLPQQIEDIGRKLFEINTICEDVALQVKSDRSNVAMMFDLRDLRSEISELLTKKVNLLSTLESQNDASGPGFTKTMHKNDKEKDPSNVDNNSSVNQSDLLLLSSVGFSTKEVEKAIASQVSAKELKSKIHSITSKKEKSMAPIMSDLTKIQAKKRNLQEKYETLTVELNNIMKSLEEAKIKEDECLTEQARLEVMFDREMSQLNGQNDGVVNALRRGESQSEILNILKTLNKRVNNVSSIIKNKNIRNKNNTAQEKKILSVLENNGGVYGTRKETINNISSYVDSEKKCISFLRKRINDANTRINKTTKELEQIVKLGLGKVEVHMRAKLDEDKKYVEEDTILLERFENQVRKMFYSAQKIVNQITDEPGTIIENDLAITIGEIKDGFIELNCCGDAASNWIVPKIKKGRNTSKGSGGGFDTDKAAALGLSALIPTNYNDTSTDTKESKQQSRKKGKSKPKHTTTAAPVFKGWGAPKGNSNKSKSLATIQREEALAKGQ